MQYPYCVYLLFQSSAAPRSSDQELESTFPAARKHQRPAFACPEQREAHEQRGAVGSNRREREEEEEAYDCSCRACCFILHPQHPTEGSLHRHLGLNGHESLINISVTAERLVLGASSLVIYVDEPAAIQQIGRAGPACREIS